MHEVIHEQEGARLGEGRLVTPQMLLEVMAAVGRSARLELLPERVLARADNTIVWWSPGQQRRMFFSEKMLNGCLFPQPPLVFKVTGRYLWVRALQQERRPGADARLCMAPYWNCYDNASVCTGSMKIPQEKSVQVIDSWEEAFFASEFTHSGGVSRHTSHSQGLLAMWHSLRDKAVFPAKYLVPLKQSLAEFIHEEDHSYRNQQL